MMKYSNLAYLVISVSLLLLSTSCRTAPDGVVDIVDDTEPVIEAVSPPVSDPEPEPEPDPIEQLEPVQDERQVYLVTEEEYIQTFDDIREFIELLNGIIKSEDYDTWLTHLTEEYVEVMGSAITLSQISEEPILKKYNIKLRSLKDYFMYVVVPSRSSARLDEIEFNDSEHVTAFMIIKGQRAILYSLIKVDNTWKIGL